MLTLSDPGSMGRQRRTHGAQVYCTSSPGERQHWEAPTKAAPRHRFWRRPQRIRQAAGMGVLVSIAAKTSGLLRRVESFRPGSSVHAAQTSACRTKGVSPAGDRALRRSEEHTSELQSQSNLVCRLLLEKKKRKKPL